MTRRMPRVVHVLEPDAPGCGPATRRVLAALQADDSVIVLGGRSAAEAVGDSGVAVTATVPVPLRNPRLAGRGLGRVLAALSPARIVAWSESALVAVVSAGTTAPVVGVVAALEPRSPRVEAWRREAAIVHPIGPEIGPALVRRGWRLGVTIAAADLPVRGDEQVDRRSTSARRASIRSRWGIEDERLVVAVTGDPTQGSDVSAAMTAAASAAVAGRGCCLVTDPMGSNAVAASHWLREGIGRFGGRPVGLVLDVRVRDPQAIAAGIDVAAQVDAPDAVAFTPPSIVDLRTWLACGVPVIASDRANAASVVRDRVDGRLLPPANRNAFIRVLMRLVDEPGLVTDMAHAAAATHGRGLPRRRPTWIWDPTDHSAGERSSEKPTAASR